MKRFTALYDALDRTTSTNAKVDAMAAYFADAPAEDAAWGVFFLSGERFKRFVGPRRLAEWAAEMSGVPSWLMEDCYIAVGDLAETIALLMPAATSDGVERPLHVWVEDYVLPLREIEDEDAQRARIGTYLGALPASQRFLFAKLLTGAMRVGVSRTLLVRGLAKASGLDGNVLQHRLSGGFAPSAEAYRALVSADEGAADIAQLYPFFLASPLEGPPEALGDPDEFFAEWKWDGIRAQLIRRAGETFLWSRGEERIEERFPEIVAFAEALPDGTVLDGEVLVWDHEQDAPAPFALLQKRIGRKKVGKKILADAPAFFMAYDVLEEDGEDLRALPMSERRARLEALVVDAPRVFRVSPLVEFDGFAELAALRETSRQRRVEGFLIKRKDSPYRTGRRRGEWWKWKVDPLTLDCVLVYAQAGHGKRAGLFTDYSFAVWDDRDPTARTLATIAKAYSGLNHDEIAELDKWIRQNTLERFGPVRSVEPVHVFELGFENVRESSRHKAGVAVRFPRILRWRRDKAPEDADALSGVYALARSLE